MITNRIPYIRVRFAFLSDIFVSGERGYFLQNYNDIFTLTKEEGRLLRLFSCLWRKTKILTLPPKKQTEGTPTPRGNGKTTDRTGRESSVAQWLPPPTSLLSHTW